MEHLQDYIGRILVGESEKVSYQLAYDTVYKLTKQRRQKEVMALLEEKVSSRLGEDREGVEDVGKVTEIIKSTCVHVTRVTEVCLFLDMNYCQKELGAPLINKMQKVLFQTLCSRDKVLDIIAKGLF